MSKVYGFCDAGCRYRVPTFDEFEKSASIFRIAPNDDGTYTIEMGKKYLVKPKLDANEHWAYNVIFRYGYTLANGEYTIDEHIYELSHDGAYAKYDDAIIKPLQCSRYLHSSQNYVTTQIYTRRTSQEGGVSIKSHMEKNGLGADETSLDYEIFVVGANEVYIYNDEATIKGEKGEIPNEWGDAIKMNTKRITNLEASLSDDIFITESSKVVPLNVAPYAAIEKIGGMTYATAEGTNIHSKAKAIKSNSKNLFKLIGWSAKADQSTLSNPCGTIVSSLEGNNITVTQSDYPNAGNLASYENGFFMFFPEEHLTNGKNYRISFDLRITNNPLNASYVHIVSNDYWNGETQIDISQTNSVQRCSGVITYNISPAHPDYRYFECRNCGMSFEIGNIMITEAEVEDTAYSLYGTIDTFAIPEAVQALDGYGEGSSEDDYNYIEKTDDGRWLFHNGDNITDITDLMPIDNFIKVEGGGLIDVVCEYSGSMPDDTTIDMPIEITYQKEG